MLRMPSSRVARALLWLSTAASASVCLTGGLLYLLHRPSLRVVASWESPPGLSWKGSSHYVLSIVETDRDWRGFPLFVDWHYIVYVGRERGTPTYGHSVEHSFTPSIDDYRDLDRHIRKSTVTWTPEGVTFAEASGHRLFIPGDVFGGGR